MPRGVVNRAWEVLEELEKPGKSARASGRRSSRPSPASRQMPLFDAGQPLLDEVLALDIPNLTPLEAINKLYELQKKARGGAEPDS